MKSLTDRFRKIAWALWVTAVLSAIIGWFFDKDPSKLAPVIMWITTAVAAGEASKASKRLIERKNGNEEVHSA